MIRLRRLALLVLSFPLGLALLAHSAPAQQGGSIRYAFADTTLLRDTLDLHFDGLFPLADSLRMVPDSLRALSIRYRLPLERLVLLADSLRVPVDSVGVRMERERYNPLATSARRLNEFGYSSTYNVGRQSTTWGNGSDYNLAWGPVFLRNVTNIGITRTLVGEDTDLHETRTSSTEVGWKFSPEYSVGGRVNLQRTQNSRLAGNSSRAPQTGIYNNSKTTNQYDFSIRTRQHPTENLSSQLDAFGGPFDEPGSIPVKRGFGSVLSGNLEYARGDWLSYDLNGQATGKFGRARIPSRAWFSTRDLSTNLGGSLSLFASGPIGFKLGLSHQQNEFQRPDTLTDVTAATPQTLDILKREPSSSEGLDAALRLQRGGENYINLAERLGESRSLIAVARNGRFTNDRSSSSDQTFTADGRCTFRGWALDARFSNGYPTSEEPLRGLVQVQTPDLSDTLVTVDYRERQTVHNRSISASLTKGVTPRLVLKASGGVDLGSYRSVVTDSSYRVNVGPARVSPAAPREDYRQFYRLEGSYVSSERLTMGLSLEVSRALRINLLASGSGSNTEDRSYRAGWRWSYRLLSGLTATQQNQLSASYNYLPFAPDKNRLTLGYVTVTTLDAVVTPRLTIHLTHNGNFAPSGQYLTAADGLDYFSRSDESHDYTLSGSIAYTPAPVLSLSLQPFYQATDVDGTIDGVAAPTSRRRSLNFSGGANLNLAVSGRGRLTGNIARTFQSSRSTRYAAGRPAPEPLFQDDFWNGALQFSWQL